ncbi:MAG: MOSC domain-containing protein, partial [Nocardioidaceae bacterium]
MAARVLSINLGRPVQHPDGLGLTAIDKNSIPGPVHAGPLGLEGDQVADLRDHGGVDQAVYAFAREDLDLWGGRLGGELRNGLFGENLTTEGIDVNESLIGERWRIGTATFEVSHVRIPCNTFKRWIAASDFDDVG